MSDLISRGFVMLDYLDRLGRKDSYKAKFEALCEAVDNAPAVDAEPVRHGRWIDKKRWSMGKWHKWLECSECKYQDYGLETYEDIPFTGPANYCPNCGARMDGGKKDAAD